MYPPFPISHNLALFPLSPPTTLLLLILLFHAYLPLFLDLHPFVFPPHVCPSSSSSLPIVVSTVLSFLYVLTLLDLWLCFPSTPSHLYPPPPLGLHVGSGWIGACYNPNQSMFELGNNIESKPNSF